MMQQQAIIFSPLDSLETTKELTPVEDLEALEVQHGHVSEWSHSVVQRDGVLSVAHHEVHRAAQHDLRLVRVAPGASSFFAVTLE